MCLHDLDVKHDFASGYEHKCRLVQTCERPPRSNIEIFTVDHSPSVVTREFEVLESGVKRRKVTKSETIRSRHVDVVAGYSSSRPNARFHSVMLDKVLDVYGGDVRTHCGVVRCSSDNCAEQHRNARFYHKIARIKHERGYSFIHTFACPHHFKGQHDGAGRDERQSLCDANANGKTLETTLKVFDYNVTHRKNPVSSQKKRRGQYSFKRFLRVFVDPGGKQKAAFDALDKEHHVKPISDYAALDLADGADDATKLKNSSRFTQFASFHSELGAFGAAKLSMREFGCPCCAPGVDTSACVNISECGPWVVQSIRYQTVVRDISSVGVETENFAKSAKKGDVCVRLCRRRA